MTEVQPYVAPDYGRYWEWFWSCRTADVAGYAWVADEDDDATQHLHRDGRPTRVGATVRFDAGMGRARWRFWRREGEGIVPFGLRSVYGTEEDAARYVLEHLTEPEA